ncbi:uncharacterized protein FA14DRAFT_114503, partial [Meira miltonrushii]
TSTRSAILFGATGAVGKPLLSELLKSPQYDQVHAFVRKPFKNESSYKEEAKLIEHLLDFEKLLEEGKGVEEIRDVKAEAVYITLGTTRANAGSAEAFERIDREYVLAAAKAALHPDQQQNQKVLYCSSFGVSAKSPFLYPKSKGLTEEGLASLGYSDTILFRPGFLAQANRAQSRKVEQIYGFVTHNILSHVWNDAEIKVAVLAKAFRVAGENGSSGL